jgi:hypothetical protein
MVLGLTAHSPEMVLTLAKALFSEKAGSEFSINIQRQAIIVSQGDILLILNK